MPSRREIITGGTAFAAVPASADNPALAHSAPDSRVSDEEIVRWTKVILAVERNVKPHLSEQGVRDLMDLFERRGDKSMLARMHGWFTPGAPTPPMPKSDTAEGVTRSILSDYEFCLVRKA